MQMTSGTTTARERVLMVAEQLFQERGYNGVSMSDLASALGMQKASLYHHASGGKEALFVEVMERILDRYRDGLEDAIQRQNLYEAQLRAAAYWLLEHPSLHYARMMQSDMPSLSAEHVQRLTIVTYRALQGPLEKVFAPEMAVRGLDARKASYLSGAFLAMIEGIHNLPQQHTTTAREAMSDFLIETLFRSIGK